MTQFPSNRNLSDLDPNYMGLFVVYLGVLQRALPGYNVLVTETRRSKERQEWLRADGKSKTLYSNHLLGKAIDIALQNKTTGIIDWSPEMYKYAYGLRDPQRYGLVAGGQIWNGFDWPHLEVQDPDIKYPTLIDIPEDVWLA